MFKSKDDDRYGITPFNGKDFSSWQFWIEAILEDQGVQYCVQTEKSSISDASLKLQFGKDDSKAKSFIIQCVSDSHLEYARDGNTSKEKFDKLLSIFERKGISNRLYLKRKLMSLKHEESSSLQEHFMFDDLVRNIKSAGSKIEDDDIICHLLLSLPESYSVVITAIESLSTDNLTLDYFKGRILDEEVKRCGLSGATVAESKSSNVFYTYNEKEICCYGCGKLGHKRNRCKLRKYKPFKKTAHIANNPSDEDEYEDENAIVFIAEQIVNSATNKHECMEAGNNQLVWLLDSAYTDHLINNDQYFADSMT